MSQPFPEEGRIPAPMRLRLFRSAFGETSLVCCGIFMLLLWLHGFLVESAERRSDVEANDVYYLSLAFLIASIAVGLSGVVYGVLAVLGFGRSPAKNYRLQGAIGATLAALLSGGLILVQILASSPRLKMAERAVPWPYVHESTGLVLHQPAKNWVVNVGEHAKRFGPNAVALAAGPAFGSETPDLLVVLEIPVPKVDPKEIDYPAFAQQLADQSSLKRRSIERVEAGRVDSEPAAIYVISGEAPRGEVRHFFASVIRGETCMQLLLITDEANSTGGETFEQILRSVDFR